jgi:DNA-directed RNA polymerase specialized sigma24 family protein
MSQAPSAFNPDLRAALVAMVRKRVPEPEVEDIVQAALAEAIDSPHAPKESEALRRWIFGVAKNKVVDYHRRAGRELHDVPDVAGYPAPHDEADLLRWAERHLPAGDEAQKTLDWMIREGEGEKLESIAASEKLPAPRVRQRVSRLRRHFKANWQREVAILAALGVIITAALLFLVRRQDPNEPIAREPVDPRAEPIRLKALERCNAAAQPRDWAACVGGLDEAKRLDPAGDDRPDVQGARRAAAKALETPPPSPPPSAVPTPSSSASTTIVLPPEKVKHSDSDFTPSPLLGNPSSPTPVPTPTASTPPARSPRQQTGPTKMQGKPQSKAVDPSQQFDSLARGAIGDAKPKPAAPTGSASPAPIPLDEPDKPSDFGGSKKKAAPRPVTPSQIKESKDGFSGSGP